MHSFQGLRHRKWLISMCNSRRNMACLLLDWLIGITFSCSAVERETKLEPLFNHTAKKRLLEEGRKLVLQCRNLNQLQLLCSHSPSLFPLQERARKVRQKKDICSSPSSLSPVACMSSPFWPHGATCVYILLPWSYLSSSCCSICWYPPRQWTSLC